MYNVTPEGSHGLLDFTGGRGAALICGASPSFARLIALDMHALPTGRRGYMYNVLAVWRTPSTVSSREILQSIPQYFPPVQGGILFSSVCLWAACLYAVARKMHFWASWGIQLLAPPRVDPLASTLIPYRYSSFLFLLLLARYVPNVAKRSI